MAADIKTRMVERTAILLATKGLQGTSFSEVLAASGAPRGSLYHHFPGGKDELVLAALKHAGERMIGSLSQAEGLPAQDVAKQFIALWRHVLELSKFSAGCAIVAVTVAAQEPTLISEASTVFRNARSHLAERLASGGVPLDRSEALAASLIAACEGAVILSRAEQSFVPFDLVAAEQIVAIEAAMRGPKDRMRDA